MNRPPKKVMEIILASLRDRPDDWIITAHAARNKVLGAEIWLANKYYGTALNIDGAEWGDVTAASSLFGWAMPWRRRLISAVEDVVIASLTRRASQTSTK